MQAGAQMYIAEADVKHGALRGKAQIAAVGWIIAAWRGDRNARIGKQLARWRGKLSVAKTLMAADAAARRVAVRKHSAGMRMLERAVNALGINATAMAYISQWRAGSVDRRFELMCVRIHPPPCLLLP